MKRIVVPIVAGVLSLQLGGCASGGPANGKLLRKVERLAQQHAAARRQIDDLNNRIFLLEDKVDTSRVALQRRPRKPVRLPVIRIRPEDVQEEEQGDGRPRQTLSGKGSGGKSLVSREDVEYRGAATRRGPRPVLRLYGTPRVAGASARRGIDPRTVREKLPMAPLASRRVAKAIAGAPAGSKAAMAAYQKALGQYRKGRYAAAVSAFRGFISSNGKHAYADNALYWLGECFYDLKQFRLAVKMFRRVVQEYPSGNKAPAALLKLGFSYIKLKDKRNARAVLAQVVEIFPRTRVARLASKTLAKLKL